MHKFAIIAIVVFLAVAGVAQLLQFSTWLPVQPDVIAPGADAVLKKIQVAALYALTPIAVAVALALALHEKKEKKSYRALGLDGSSM